MEKVVVKFVVANDKYYQFHYRFYDEKSGLKIEQKSELIPFGMFGKKRAERTAKMLVLSFIDETDNTTVKDGVLYGQRQKKNVSFILPQKMLTEAFLQRAIARKSQEKAFANEIGIDKEIKEIILGDYKEKEFSLKAICYDKTVFIRKRNNCSSIAKGAVMPVVKSFLSFDQPITDIIEETGICIENERPHYFLRNIYGHEIKVEFNNHFFDIHGVGLIERIIYNDQINRVKMREMNEKCQTVNQMVLKK